MICLILEFDFLVVIARLSCLSLSEMLMYI